MKNIFKLTLLGLTIALPAEALEGSFNISYPPTNHETTDDRISIIGTAPLGEKVSVNGKPIKLSNSGSFEPSLPLKMGVNVFTVRHQNEEIKIKVTRTVAQAERREGLGFAKDSLTPKVDVARLPGELLCFGAIAPTNATVSVNIGGQTIPLTYQPKVVNLPDNKIVLTQLSNQPQQISGAGHYLGCAAAEVAADLGIPLFQLSKDDRTVTQAGSGKVQILSPAKLEIAEVIVDGGIARTGPSTDYSRLTPLPKGTIASVTGREGEWVRLDYGGWINSKEVRILPSAIPPKTLVRSIRAKQVAGATEVSFPLQIQVPMLVQQSDRTLKLTLYNTTAQTDIIRFNDDPLVSRLDWQQTAPGIVEYTFNFKTQQQWGYKLEYRGTTLVLTLRHPPTRNLQSVMPLEGVKIVLDPGHGGTDSGAVSSTGGTEKEMNLIMSKLIADELIARGATVYLTRETDKAVSLPDRVTFIDRVQPAIALSIHHNALPAGGDTANTAGFGSFWYHAQAHSLAVSLHNYVVQYGDRPSYGVFWDNLALARPTIAPSLLLELGFMSNPKEYAEKVSNPVEQQKLATALADGITQWLLATR
jgi:N-acetylmuramoyl-L-alanine amidase